MHVSRKTFDALVEAAIASLPEPYARWLDEVPVIVEDRPRKKHDGREAESPDDDDAPLGVYSGHSITQRSVEHSGDLPPRIMIYRIPLMEACASRQQLADEIRKTLLHELGHHAGLDEDDLDRLGYGPLEDDDEIDWDLDDHR